VHAVVIAEPGSSADLEIRQEPDPVAGEGEVLVRAEVAGVNFIDVYRRTGAYPYAFPHTPGIEGGGHVVGVGPGVHGVDVGDRVAWGWVPDSYAELVRVPLDKLVPVPDDIDLATAVGGLVQGMTAYMLVDEIFEVRAGQDVLVHAAAGGLGLLLTQICAGRGARVVGTVSTAEKEARARAAGASEVIRYDQLDDVTAEVPRRVRSWAPQGVHVAYDGVGRLTFDASLASLRRGGMVALYGQASGPVPPLDLQRLNTGGSLAVAKPNVTHFIDTRAELLALATRLFDALASGALEVAVHREFALADAAAAHDALEGRASIGKVLLRIQSPDDELVPAHEELSRA
jgi:NADPH2:quinone reductase